MTPTGKCSSHDGIYDCFPPDAALMLHMHDRHEHQHIPPVDPPHEKRPRLIKPIHVIVGALILVGILVIYLLLIARAGY